MIFCYVKQCFNYVAILQLLILFHTQQKIIIKECSLKRYTIRCIVEQVSPMCFNL